MFKELNLNILSSKLYTVIIMKNYQKWLHNFIRIMCAEYSHIGLTVYSPGWPEFFGPKSTENIIYI